jgi:MOSC domain-containing protein YiiM
METISDLTSRFPRDGRVTFIGVRPARLAPVTSLANVLVTLNGPKGDHRAKPGARAVTLIQAEHIASIAAFSGRNSVAPEMLRRNLAITGINLLALVGWRLRVGDAVLEVSGICAPCSRMEAVLGPGGYNAMRGHGGVTASVVTPGLVRLGDVVEALASAASVGSDKLP